MSNTGLIGKEHNTHLDWLLNTWMTGNSNSPVCFLEGFPGTGKTTIANELLRQAAIIKQTAIKITAPETDTDPTDDLLLDLAMELNSAGRDELAKAIENNRPLLDVLSNVVNDPILIIIDEFQRSMQGTRAMTLGGFAKVLSTLANRKWLKGRILLLTNRLVERARWSEPYAIRTLSGMSPNDGVELLEHFALENGRLDEIAPERRHDVVKWLGGNPRAIRLVVKSLNYDSLDDLIGIQPELWEMRDREVSPDLVADLERDLLEKTLSQLSDNYLRSLYRLSVHRKPFKRQAIENLFDEKPVYAHFKREIIDRFLMEQHNNWFSLHPIVREIGLQKLGNSPKDIEQAYYIAARYYTRHFEAQQVVGWGALGGHFVESRYHLVKAGRPDDLKNIASRFQNHIFSTLSGTLPIPSNPEELDERIAVLSALLETPGPKNLEYHLARLFQVRNQRNDLGRALHHAHRAKSNTFVAAWLLCSELLVQMGRNDEAITLLKQGINRVPLENDLAALINRCSQLLAQMELYDEAITLLLEGIERIPPDKGLVSLYISCGELLGQRERYDEAITLMKQGIERIPSNKNLVSLYISCGELLGQRERYDEAIALMKQGIERIPPNKNLADLYISCGMLLVKIGQNEEAITILKEGINQTPVDKNLSPIYLCYAKLLVFVYRTNKAVQILLNGINKIPTQYDADKLVEPILMLYTALQDKSKILEIYSKNLGSLQKALAQTLLYQVQDRWEDAAEYVEQIRQKGIQSNQLVISEAFSWLCAGLPEQALDALSSPLKGEKSARQWLYAFIQFHLGNLEEAKKALAAYDKELSILNEVNREILLTLWDQPSIKLEQFDLAYYFPTLPPLLTGLPHSVTRITFHPSVLPDSIKTNYPLNNYFNQKQENKMDNNNAIETRNIPEVYIDFDLHIGSDGQVFASSDEGQVTDRISIQPPNDIRLALQLIDRRHTDAALLKDVGSSLYNWLFPNSIHTHLQQTEAVARQNKAKLRLRLRIEAATIASLPLEFIYRAIGGYFLAVNPDTVFSRYLNLPLPQERVRRREGSLHMLAIIADPIDQVRLNPDEWETIIMEALAKPLTKKQITLHTVKRATRKAIRDALLEQKPDIIQFVGHGIYEDAKGYLALVDENTNKTWLVDDESFANLFLGLDDHLGLISMATCESAQSDNPQGFLGIAPQLVQRGIPAVVAMQYEVYIKTAKVFLEDFYTSVAARKPIDWAVQSARKAVSLDFKLDNREFATPVLYMRAKDGNVF